MKVVKPTEHVQLSNSGMPSLLASKFFSCSKEKQAPDLADTGGGSFPGSLDCGKVEQKPTRTVNVKCDMIHQRVSEVYIKLISVLCSESRV